MSTEARQTLDAKLDAIELAVRHAQEYEHEKGLSEQPHPASCPRTCCAYCADGEARTVV